MSDNDTFDNDDDLEVDGDVGYSPTATDELSDDGSAAAIREAMRQQLQSDVEAFLARGGRINEIPANVVSDPPKKPQSNYGGQPI